MIKLQPFFFALAATFGLSFLSAGHADVLVSDQQRFAYHNKQIEVGPNQYRQYQIQLGLNDTLEVYVEIQSGRFTDLTVMVCPADQVEDYLAGNSAVCFGSVKQRNLIQFDYVVPQDGLYSVVIDNTHAAVTNKTARFITYRKWQLDEETTNNTRAVYAMLYDALDGVFIYPDFDIFVNSCADDVLFLPAKKGSIRMCSELAFPLMRDEQLAGLYGDFFHEFGHSMLGFWGVPEADSDKRADEFVVYIFYLIGREDLALGFAEYIEVQTLNPQANAVWYHGSRHPKPAQRARSIRRTLRSPAAVMSSLNGIIYPHLTQDVLNEIIADPEPFGDPALARQYLDE